MTRSDQDIWSDWLLHRRYGDDPRQRQTGQEYLYAVRDTVLRHAELAEGETLLDVGSGTGLIAFGALDKVQTSSVIISDISQDLLNHARSAAQELGVLDRCRFLLAGADDLSALGSACADVVTTRSVLIYVPEKQRAFDEFYRVLKPGGRLSIFEPINQFCYPEPPHLFRGYDVTPVMEIADKVRAIYRRIQPPETDPMLNFNERDLIAFAERAGFCEIRLELQVNVTPPSESISWETYVRIANNPKVPTLDEAIRQALSPREAEQFAAHLRPLVEAKQGVSRSAVAYLWAIKH